MSGQILMTTAGRPLIHAMTPDSGQRGGGSLRRLKIAIPRWMGLLSLFVTSFCCGCSTAPQSDYGALELVQATGTVTLDGEPLPDAVVTFEAEDGQFAFGLTDDSGRYQLQLDSVKKGVTTGTKVVRISTTRKILGLNSEEDGDQEGPGEGKSKQNFNKELVPDAYNRNSDLKVEVTPNETVHDFDLKTK